MVNTKSVLQNSLVCILCHSFIGQEESDSTFSYHEESDQETGFTTFVSDPEEIYLLKLLKNALIKRLAASEIVLMNDYEINHVSGECTTSLYFEFLLLYAKHSILIIFIKTHFIVCRSTSSPK